MTALHLVELVYIYVPVLIFGWQNFLHPHLHQKTALWSCHLFFCCTNLKNPTPTSSLFITALLSLPSKLVLKLASLKVLHKFHVLSSSSFCCQRTHSKAAVSKPWSCPSWQHVSPQKLGFGNCSFSTGWFCPFQDFLFGNLVMSMYVTRINTELLK